MSKILAIIKKDLASALKKKQTEAILTLRGLLAALQNRQIEIGKKEQLKEEEVISVLQKEAKKRKEAIEAYRQAGRKDLLKKEKADLRVIEKYLPRPLEKEEILRVIKDVLQRSNASTPKELGKVMGLVMGKLKGRAEGSFVKKLVEKELRGPKGF